MRLSLILLAAAGVALAAEPPTKPAPKSDGDTDAVQRVIAARKEYQNALVGLYDVYAKSGDKERIKWLEDELKGFHLTAKPAYRLDLADVFPAGCEPKENVKEANDLFRTAMGYKDKGFGTDLLLNQRRAEITLHEIIQKHPKSDKLADVAYELGDLYEGKAFKQYARAAAFYEKSCGWQKGTRTDARLRAARLYDKTLTDRQKAIEMYREVVAHDTDPDRLKEAERRLADLTGNRR